MFFSLSMWQLLCGGFIKLFYKVSSLVSNESNDVNEADIHRGAQVGLAPVHEGGPHAERNKSL